jgi:hypothetical protein
VTAAGIGQRIESNNCWDLVGSSATLSVDIKNSVLTSVVWTASYATTTADTFGTIGTPTKTTIATGTFTVTSSLVRYTADLGVIPAGAEKGIEILFTVGAQTSGTWVIGNVQLEKGAVATPFEFRPYGTELQLCQRYLPVIAAGSYLPAYSISTINAYSQTTLQVATRVAPTGITTTVSGNLYAASVGIALTNITFTDASTTNILLTAQVASGLTAGQGTMLWTTNQILGTGCEL